LSLAVDRKGDEPNLGAVYKSLAYLHLPSAFAILGRFQLDLAPSRHTSGHSDLLISKNGRGGWT
jgi:hypothetical protein